MWFDIYVATRNRSRACIDQFLNQYVDLLKENVQHDFEVRLSDTEEFVETGTLQKSIELGLANPTIRFTLYLTGKQQDLKSVMVHFATNGLLIFGLSIEEETQEGSNRITAENLLAQMKHEFSTSSGMIVVEIPPVELEEELERLTERNRNIN